jgi:hypothetical protein
MRGCVLVFLLVSISTPAALATTAFSESLSDKQILDILIHTQR